MEMEVGVTDTQPAPGAANGTAANTSGHVIGNTSGIITSTGPSSVPSPAPQQQPQQQPGLHPAASAPEATSIGSIPASTESSAISCVRAATTATTVSSLSVAATIGVNKPVSVSSSTSSTLSSTTTLASTKMSATTAVTPTTASNNNNNNATNSGGQQTVKSCAGCGARIVDRFLLHAMDRYWHTGCLKCSCCQAQLGEIGTSCFTKAGMILCKNDYIRLFGSSGTCAACSQNIPAQEFVMRTHTNVYHVNCFTCVTCHQRLVPGDRYSIVNGSLICEQDYPKALKGLTSIPMRPTHKVNNNNTNINNRNEADMLPYY